MTFDLDKSLEILRNTPAVLKSILFGLSDEWVFSNEGPGTWSPYDIVGHFIHGEKTDWITRSKIILSNDTDKTFEPFDRFAQFTDSKGKSLQQLLDEFERLRIDNLNTLKKLNPDQEALAKRGIHPDFGEVTLKELLATWVAHDLNHISQLCRVMAKQYRSEVGPWREYLGILRR